MRNEVSKLVLKAADKLISVKVLSFLFSCAFLYLGKIDQSGWIQALMIILGARTANEIVAMVKK